MTVKNVYQAISNVQKALAESGITKDRKNAQQGYQFRGIDDIYNKLSKQLAANNLLIMPRVLGREVVERQTKDNKPLFYVVVDVEFDFISAEDGSVYTAKTYGEAMDSADKATNKAMSAAYKYACLMTFCIPTEGDNDADATTHEVAPEFDWPMWFKEYGANVRSATTLEALEELVKANKEKTGEASKISPKNHAKLINLINERREELTQLKTEQGE